MAQRTLPLDRYHRLLAQALEMGARRVTLMRTVWHIAGDCYAPYTTSVFGRREKYRPDDPASHEHWWVVKPGGAHPGWLEIETRCRRCDRCLRTRSRKWRGAATAEMKASSRTWFGTLTLTPAEHFKALSNARKTASLEGVDYDRLSDDEKFLRRCRATAPDLTKYLKRIRKNKPGLRYLLITERHKSGLPHFHMLVHEAPLGAIVTHRELSSQWKLGFERWRLSDPHKPREALYLCKYLSKSLQARVRASQGYGVTTSQLHTHVIAQLRKVGRVNPLDDDSSEPEW